MASTKGKNKMPNLDNATPGALADWLGDTREKLKELKKLEGYYKQALIARLEGERPITVHGDTHGATIIDMERETLSTASIRAHVDPKIWEPYLSTTEFVQINTNRVSNGDSE